MAMLARTTVRGRTGCRALLLCGALSAAPWLILVGCSGKKPPARSEAPRAGVVGQVTTLRGEATWSVGASDARTPLRVGDAVRAEWTVHTGPGAQLTVRLQNGHLWTLDGDLSKRVASVQALTLPPVREGALAQVTDLGGRAGTDRTSAAGLYHEMAVGTKASSTRGDQIAAQPAPEPSRDPTLDEAPRDTKPGAKGFTDGRAKADPEPRRPPPPTVASPQPARRPAEAGLGLKGGGAGATASSAPRGGGTSRSPQGGGGGGVRREPASKSGAKQSPKKAFAHDAEKPAAAPPPQPAKPNPAAVLTVLGPHQARIAAVLRQHGLTGRHQVRLLVDGDRGRVRAVWIIGQASSHPACAAIQRLLAAVPLPRTTGLYRQDLVVEVK